MKRQEPEKLLQESIAQRLSLEQRVPFNHIFAPRNLKDGVRAKRMGFQPGWPDIILPSPGTVGIEIKTSSGRQSEVQRAIQRQWTDYEMHYLIAHSYDEFFELVEQYCKWGYE